MARGLLLSLDQILSKLSELPLSKLLSMVCFTLCGQNLANANQAMEQRDKDMENSLTKRYTHTQSNKTVNIRSATDRTAALPLSVYHLVT